MRKKNKKFTIINSKKAVAPVIATLLLVAVAVVGGTMNFVFTQQYFNSAQASGLAGIESMVFIGYDATDKDSLIYHDGIISNPVANWHGDQISSGLDQGERIAIYIQNNGIKKMVLQEVRIAGSVYEFQDMGPANKMTAYSANVLESGEYTIVKNGNKNAPADTISGNTPELQSGQHVTIVLELDKNFNIGRDMQIRLTTGNGGIWVYTAMVGQQND